MNRGKLGDVPAYRVVAGSGILSGAASFETYDQQKLLLEAEGVEVWRTDRGWKTDLKKYGWKNTIEEAEHFRRIFEKEQI